MHLLDSTNTSLAQILAALLLTTNQPLSLKDMAQAFDLNEQPSAAQLKAALEELSEQLSNTCQQLVEVSSGWRIQIRPAFSPWVGRLLTEKPPRYSRALLETLALIAYRQPITRSEIEEVRGVSLSSQLMRTLEDREWIRVLGTKEVPGRPLLYGTTSKFLDYFNLKSLAELPPLDELKQLAVSQEKEWQDKLDQQLNASLQKNAQLAAGAEEEAANKLEQEERDAEILNQPLPEISKLTFAELVERHPASDEAAADKPDEEGNSAT